jgi:hypothetical protein
MRRVAAIVAMLLMPAAAFAQDAKPQTTSTTTLVSAGDGSNRGVGPTKGSGGESAMRIALLCAGQMPSSSSEL